VRPAGHAKFVVPKPIYTMKSKVIIGGIIGGVACFFLGWLVYGMLLADYMKNNMNDCANRPMDGFVWWAMILSNLVWGYFIALILDWTNSGNMSAGLQKGALIGLLYSLSIDFSFYAMTTVYSSTTAIIVDVAASTTMNAIAGAIIGWYMGMGKKDA
jgi:hypothetical protein